MVYISIAAIIIITLIFLQIRFGAQKQIQNLMKMGFVLPAILIAYGLFSGLFFWAEPGYKYHVRTVAGQEYLVQGTGFHLKLFGRVNDWKNALTVQALPSQTTIDLSAEGEADTLSATIPAKRVVFLDQVDAKVSGAVRWKLPDSEEEFLRLVHDFRTPENFLRTELIPAFLETIDANATLMSAEDYFSGGRSTFVSDFEEQMRSGLYQVRRIEVLREAPEQALASANAALGEEQENFGNNRQVVYSVEKIVDAQGVPIRKEQSYSRFGVTVVSARVTSVAPNEEFEKRMTLKQQAAADRAIAREQRIQEEERRLLEIAKGEREVAERQAQAKVEQIEATTNAETQKQLSITEAERIRESEAILKDAAAIQLERAELEAEALKVRADAEAYQKSEILKADNALQAKLDAEMEIQRVWADAFSKRQVPQMVFGSDGAPNGGDTEGQALQQLLSVYLAERLDVDRKVENE